MTMIRTRELRRGIRLLPVAALAVLVAGCGTHRPGEYVRADGTAGSPAAVARQSAPVNFRCPGESSAPTPTPSATVSTPLPTAPVTDHFAENHGFEVPFPLYGQDRCDGLAAVARIRTALDPLRKRGDFSAESARSAIAGLGYPVGKVRTDQDGPTGVGFLVDTYPLCVEGTMDRDTVRADAFGGYPDHPGCDRPTGGH